MQWELSIASSIAKEFERSEPNARNERVLVHRVASGLAQGQYDDNWPAQLQELMNMSHKTMRLAVLQEELNSLREIYTLCCILGGILQFKLLQCHEAIATLDHAIIVAGASGRLELVLHIIDKIQLTMLQESTFESIGSSVQLNNNNPTETVDTIPSISPPSFPSFQTKISKTPFILRNYARDWPAMEERPWRSAAYLRSIAGPGRVVPVEIGHDYRSEAWKQRIMPWDDFLATLDLEDQFSAGASDMLYLAQHDLTIQFPSLRDDIIIPDYVYASLTPSDYPKYRQPFNDDKILFNTWLGPKGTMSPAHTDPYYNCYVQVVGYKSIWLAPPSATPFMYPISGSTEAHRTLDLNEDQSPSNTSRVDVFADAPDNTNFPKFEEQVVPISMTARLGPGDVLFFPPGWWHAMRSETTSFSFSLWF